MCVTAWTGKRGRHGESYLIRWNTRRDGTHDPQTGGRHQPHAVSLESMGDSGNATNAIETLMTGTAAKPLLIAGMPGAGKTTLAYRTLLDALRRFGDNGAVMCVPNRTLGSKLSDMAIRELGALAQARPVTTLSALAFRIIAADRSFSKLPTPKLLNGAEQDALLRQVLAVHLGHAVSGDLCDTCRLLRYYFAQDDWAGAVAPGLHVDGTESSTTAAMLENGISPSFVGQLRDMLARMDELGVKQERESELLDAPRHLPQDDWRDAERMTVQWRLAFALRDEYAQALANKYPDEYRLDASKLLVEGAAALERESGESADSRFDGTVPDMLIVDDFQDTTLAGLRFIETLHGRGVRIMLTGNPDESVQTFRGSYPEYLFDRARQGALQAQLIELGDAQDAGTQAPDQRTLVAARVSLSIASSEPNPLPIPRRPGKMPAYQGAWPISTTKQADDSLQTAIYRSPREELDDVVWRIKRSHLDRGSEWNDMAVIAHDNATVRQFGERLRRDGVPVRYSSVTRPLKSEPFVQGLFALIELARLREQGVDGTDMSLENIGAFARTRICALMGSALVTTGSKPGEGAPARIEPIESAMNSLESLAGLDGVTAGSADSAGAADSADSSSAEGVSCANGDKRNEKERDDSEGSDLARIVREWNDLQNVKRRSEHAATIQVADVADGTSLNADGGKGNDDGGGRPVACTVLAQYAMLVLDAKEAPCADVLGVIGSVVGGGPHLKAFQRVFRLIDRVAEGMRALPSREPQFVLALAWDVTGVAENWQRMALSNTPEGRAANDRLDAAMRLFQYAQGGMVGTDIVGFIDQVRSMEIEADSLAKTGPVEQAVTLTTPAGAAGRHWSQVWIPAVQQDVWPNLAERATLFGGEDLADVVLHGTDGAQAGDFTHDARLETVLASEEKSFLVALTRGTSVMVSAVLNDDSTPSDFMYGYMPEHCPRDAGETMFATVGTDEDGGEFAGLDTDPRGLVTQARVTLARYPEDSPQARDARRTLALLAEYGVDIADPDNWPFLNDASQAQGNDESKTPDAGITTRTVEETMENGHPVVTLSPSAVDNLWACPVCWLMENRFAGPRIGSAATSFGTLIHAVAQKGSEEGLDLPGAVADSSVESKVDTVAHRLVDIYDAIKPDFSSIAKASERYAAMLKDEQAESTLHNLASYFVESNGSDYLNKNAGKFDIGVLESASCEEEFSARFGLDDILAAYNALPGMNAIGRTALMQLMGALVGGWPEGMCEDLTVRLSGRIDRKETRRLRDGSQAIRLIDYKTGRKRQLGEIFNDLQLVCYQLGLAFPEHGRGGAAPRIAQSALFYVQDDAAPATSYSPESAFQPPLLLGGALNAEGFTARDHYPRLDKFTDIPALPADKPDTLDAVDENAWQGFLSWNGTQAMWSLTMIARVFYAAAASRSHVIVAHPTKQHKGHCRMTDICPACAGQIDTVFETRQA